MISIEQYRQRISLDEPFQFNTNSPFEIESKIKRALEFYSSTYNFKIPSKSAHRRAILRNIGVVRHPNDKVPIELEEILAFESQNEPKIDVTNLAYVSESMPSSIYDCANKIALYHGDITHLLVDAIVNAANSQLLGCFQPSHLCIDNIIHAKAGPKVRDDCEKIMSLQKREEKRGFCKATRGYHLPCKFILHTVGPEPHGTPSTKQSTQLVNCYQSCLSVADQLKLSSVAFPCVSTGLFGFPQQLASKLALAAIREWFAANPNTTIQKVVINTFEKMDERIYKANLQLSSVNQSSLEIMTNPPGDLDKALLLEDDLLRAVEYIKNADAILVTAGAGLSASAGLDYTDTELFAKLFPDMVERGFSCMYEFIGNSLTDPLVIWGYLCRQITQARFNWPLHPVYHKLLDIVKRKPYFVCTTNADGMFERHSFDKNHIYTPQGDYSLLQCRARCTEQVWDSEPIFKELLSVVDEKTGLITNPALIPKCKNCGGSVFLNVNGGSFFIQTHRKEKKRQYLAFLQKYENKNLVVMDIGTGFNTPSVIRWPAEEITRNGNNTHLIRINGSSKHAVVPNDIKEKSVELPMDAYQALNFIHSHI